MKNKKLRLRKSKKPNLNLLKYLTLLYGNTDQSNTIEYQNKPHKGYLYIYYNFTCGNSKGVLKNEFNNI